MVEQGYEEPEGNDGAAGEPDLLAGFLDVVSPGWGARYAPTLRALHITEVADLTVLVMPYMQPALDQAGLLLPHRGRIATKAEAWCHR